ncbi:TPA: fibrinogen-binding adhesin SdrG C-terminal domain-containing protein [Staphylococcus delphini]|nr:fibrinogen-binding adhesin SdrG C-terminal domain-containing protein [Staphylococcus delphini]HEC2203100.1 fibrinogen-binding adhesin SdrG C-terminal domain-containing protein [Staphylococcus delphini]
MFINNREKFSIRKFKLGASSVLIGGMIFGIIGGNDAKANENTDNQREVETTVVQQSVQNDGNGNAVNQEAMINDGIEQTEINEDSKLNEQPEVPQQDTEKVKAEPVVSKEVSEQKAMIESTPNEKQPAEEVVNHQEVQKVKANDGIGQQQVQLKLPISKPQVSEARQMTSPDVKPVTGTDVTSKVIVKETSQIVNPNEEKQGNVVKPHNGQRLQLKLDLSFDKDIKQGDFFDFMLSNNVNTNGVSTLRKVPEIKNGSVVMATGEVLENGKIRYTFTDYIDNKIDVKANLLINLFVDPKVVQQDGEQTMTATLNGKKLEKQVKVEYLNGVVHRGIGVNGAIETINKENSKFTHVAYINLKKTTIQSTSLYGRVTSGFKTGGQNPNIKIYEFVGSGMPPQSVYLNQSDASQWKDVTDSLKSKLTLNNNGYQLNFDSLDKLYAVYYEGEYQNDAQDLNFQTTLSGYPNQYYPWYYGTVTWKNGVVFYQNDGKGNGQNGPITEFNDFEYSEETGNGGVQGQSNGNRTFTEDTIDDQPIYQQGGHEPIEWEEDTTPDGDNGHNDGTTIVEESEPIEWEEDTMPDGESGHHDDETEEEDTQPIEQEETTPEDEGSNNDEEVKEDPITESEQPIHSNVGDKQTQLESTQPVKEAAHDTEDNQHEVRALPNTGESHKNITWFAGFMALVGSVLLFRRRQKEN